MPHAQVAGRYRAYSEALRRRVCSVCLDGADDGRCGLAAGETCPLDEHLVALVDLLLSMRARHDTHYSGAVEAHVCVRCTRRDPSGACGLRNDGRCALSVYLPLIVEAVAEVAARSSVPASPLVGRQGDPP